MASNDTNLKATKLNNVKSKFILKKIFDNIPKIKGLNIIRYNKSIQNKLNIDINLYKIEYSQIIFEIQIYIPGMKKTRVIRRPKKRDSFDKLEDELGGYRIDGLKSDGPSSLNSQVVFSFKVDAISAIIFSCSMNIMGYTNEL